MKLNMSKRLKLIGKKESGYSLLEYCAGAAVICGIVWTAMTGLSQNMSGFLSAIGSWVSNRQTEISPDGQGGGGNPTP